MDRQTILENLTAIETTAKLLANALSIRTTDEETTDFHLDEIHRKELINQTSIFLEQAEKVVRNVSNSLNLPSEKEKNAEKTGENVFLTKTFDEMIEENIEWKDLFPSVCPSISTTLVDLIKSSRSIENLDDSIKEIFDKIFEPEERSFSRLDGRDGKLNYSSMKRRVFDCLVDLLIDERENRSIDDEERRKIYFLCEKTSPELNFRPIELEEIETNDEKLWICKAAEKLCSIDELKRVERLKKENPNNLSKETIFFSQVRISTVFSLKQKLVERFNIDEAQRERRWTNCVESIVDSIDQILRSTRNSKRKTFSKNFQEKFRQIDRSKCDVFDYANEILKIIRENKQKNLPNFDQLQFVQRSILRFYWTDDFSQTWSKVLQLIEHNFPVQHQQKSFRNFYRNYLLETNQNNSQDIDQILQIN